MNTRAKKTRQHILDVASTLFYRKGIRAVGVDAVVAEAGVAKMTLYSHFKSKDELVAAYLKQAHEKFMTKVKQELNDLGYMSPLEKIFLIFDLYEEGIHDPEFRGCPFINGTVEIADDEHPATMAIQSHCDEFKTLLSNLVKETDVPNPEEVVGVIWAVIAGSQCLSMMTDGTHHIRSGKKAIRRLLAAT